MWLTTKKASELLGISERAVRKRVKTGKLVGKWVKGERGGRSGRVLLVWIEEPIEEPLGNQPNILENKNIAPIAEPIAEPIGEPVNIPSDTRNLLGGGGIDGDIAQKTQGFRQSFGQSSQNDGRFLGNESCANGHEIWLTVEEVAGLLKLPVRTVKFRCAKGIYKVQQIKSRGRKGIKYLVALSSLPPDAQARWVTENPDAARSLSPEARSKLAPAAQLELMKMEAPADSVGLEVFTAPKAKERLAKKVAAVQKALSVPPGWKRTEWIEHVADEFDISLPTLYRDIKRYKELGLAGLVKVKRDSSPRSWDKEALEYMAGVYLKMLREAGAASKRKAYLATLEQAKRRGWKVGSQSSAYEYLKNLNPLLEKYARGGRRALDNLFYIMRNSFKDLAPFEIIVGDQHRFDFWVRDVESGRIFRPEAFVWLDLRTRLVYGITVTKDYDRYSVAHAMRMGLKRFGLFQTAYTDNGKPELSHYVQTIINDIAGWGANIDDISELYKTDEGYVIEGADGPVEIVSTKKRWHRRARAYNAKAKPIERFFRTFESLLVDIGVPGLVREIKALSEEKALADKRLKKLIEEDKLLSFEEFLVKVFEAVEIYNNRRHASLRRSPMDELFYAIEKEGFKPTYIADFEIDFVLLARTARRVQRGRILLNGTWYQGETITEENLEAGLWHIPDSTPIEIRYDPFDPETVIAVLPDGSIRHLHPVPLSSMKNPRRTNELMQWKRRMIKAVAEHYKRLTKPVPGLIEFSSRTHRAAKARRKPQRNWEVIEKGQVRKVALKRPVFHNDFEYYRWCVDQLLNGFELTQKDKAFMREYEMKMDPSERAYWEGYRKIKRRDVS